MDRQTRPQVAIIIPARSVVMETGASAKGVADERPNKPMSNELQIRAVPRDRWDEALAVLLGQSVDTTSSQVAELRELLGNESNAGQGFLGLFQNQELLGVTWVQLQAGRIAHLWPPRFAGPQTVQTGVRLIERAVDMARRHGVVLVQALLLTDSGLSTDMLRAAGFEHAADLLYLVSMATEFPLTRPQSVLTFEPITDENLGRLKHIIERTYDNTRDCPQLNAVRSIDDVLRGYRTSECNRPELWFLGREADRDVGCLLLADHATELWELVYMGIVPEARGRGLGLEVTRYAQWLAAQERVGRMVLAVDAANEPAINVYVAAGFIGWDRRSVYLRVLSRAAP